MGREDEAEGYDPAVVKAKYLAERDKRLVPGRADIRDLAHDEHFAGYRRDPFTPYADRRAGRRRRRRGDRGRRHRRPPRRGRAAQAGHRADPHHRPGGRRGRHLVLEPLPRRDVRHRVVHLPPDARGARLHPHPALRLGRGDPGPPRGHRRAGSTWWPTRSSTPAWTAPSGTRAPPAGTSAPTAATSVSCRYYVIAVGILNLLKLPAIEGMETFAGPSFHTARWDYEVTGGAPGQPLTNLGDKAVASSAPAPLASSAWPRWWKRPSTCTCSSAHHRPSASAATDPLRPGVRRRPWSRGGSRPAWTTSRPSCWAATSTRTRSTTAGPTTTPPSTTSPCRGMTLRGVPPLGRGARLLDHGGAPPPGRGARGRPRHGGAAEAVLPLHLQAAVLPRRVPVRLEPPERHGGRLPFGVSSGSPSRARWSTASCIEVDCIVYGTGFEAEVTPAVPPGRPRDHRPRRRQPGRQVGRRRGQPVRHDEPRFPELLRHARARPAGRGHGELHPAGRARCASSSAAPWAARPLGREAVRRERRGRGRMGPGTSWARSPTPAASCRSAHRRGSTSRATPSR